MSDLHDLLEKAHEQVGALVEKAHHHGSPRPHMRQTKHGAVEVQGHGMPSVARPDTHPDFNVGLGDASYQGSQGNTHYFKPYTWKPRSMMDVSDNLVSLGWSNEPWRSNGKRHTLTVTHPRHGTHTFVFEPR